VRTETKRVRTAAAVAAGIAVVGLGAVEGRHALRGHRKRERRYRLRLDRPARADLRRVLDGRFEVAIGELDQHGGEPETRVHHARTTVKRLRSALRLIRDTLDRGTYDDVNAELRAAGHALGAARDATAAAGALEALAARYPEEIDAAEYACLRERIGADAQKAAGELDEGARRSLEALGAARADLAAWPQAEVAVETLVGGFTRSYARARRARHAALTAPSDENLHTWRRRVKDLRYQAELLEDIDRKRLRKLACRTRALADVLGEDHDLAGLRRLAADCTATVELIDRRRARLRDDAAKLGDRIFARHPRAVARRLAGRARTQAEPSGTTRGGRG
jgi:CHAD domain-containing protein